MKEFFGRSENKSCQLVGISRSFLKYQTRKMTVTLPSALKSWQPRKEDTVIADCTFF